MNHVESSGVGEDLGLDEHDTGDSEEVELVDVSEAVTGKSQLLAGYGQFPDVLCVFESVSVYSVHRSLLKHNLESHLILNPTESVLLKFSETRTSQELDHSNLLESLECQLLNRSQIRIVLELYLHQLLHLPKRILLDGPDRRVPNDEHFESRRQSIRQSDNLLSLAYDLQLLSVVTRSHSINQPFVM